MLPLGAAALAGTAFPIDREALARDLGFAAVSAEQPRRRERPRLRASSSSAAAAITGMHLSRLAADLTLWATAEFGFVEFSDAFATGSSIMPQKKNPDVAELIRGKSGRLYGNLVAVLTAMKGLPLAYNSDMQEDKEPLLRLRRHAGGDPRACCRRCWPRSRSAPSACARAAGENFATATDLADYLVRKGLPFREAHEIVGRVVRHAHRARARTLEALALEELRRFSPLIEADVHGGAHRGGLAARARASTGGTAPEAVRRALAQARDARGARDARPAAAAALAAVVVRGAPPGVRSAPAGATGPPVAPERRVAAAGDRPRAAVVRDGGIELAWTIPRRRVDNVATARPRPGCACFAPRTTAPATPKPALRRRTAASPATPRSATIRHRRAARRPWSTGGA